MGVSVFTSTGLETAAEVPFDWTACSISNN
jgi:hypothetical protein